MLDQCFLDRIVLSVALLCQAMPKQMMAVKDIHSVNIFCSDFLATRTGIGMDQLIGKKIWPSLYDGDVTFEKILIAEDEALIHSREPKTFLKVNRFGTSLVPYIARKTPLINPQTNNVVGILVQGYEIGITNLTKNIIQKIDSHKKATDLKDRPKLSKREKEVIFFFMANLSSQEIADIIYDHEGKPIAKSTIDSIFNDQLYAKFDVYNRVALYQKLQSLGYDQVIPKELLSSMSVMLNVIQTY